MRRYVFSEFTPIEELTHPRTLALLASEELLVYVAIPPALHANAAEIIKRCHDAGVAVGVWPLLDDHDGRWASDWNAAMFANSCRSLAELLDAKDARPDAVIIDLEPPIAATKRAVRGQLVKPRGPREDGFGILRQLVRELGSNSLSVSAVVAPWAACGAGAPGWQRLMGTPIDGVGFDRVFAMAYTSLLEGYSRGALQRDHAESLLARWSMEVALRYGDRAAVAIGVVGIGALGDERTYRNETELARDVAICRAQGCEHLALFNLRGLLARPDPSAWLAAFASDQTLEAPAPSKRVRGLLRIFDGAGRLALRATRERQA